LAFQTRLPAPVLARPIEAGRRRPVERRGAIEAADLDVDRARIAIAAPNQHGVRAFDLATAQVGLDPDFRFETHAAATVGPSAPPAKWHRGLTCPRAWSQRHRSG